MPIAIMGMGISECSKQAPPLNWQPKIYVGDSASRSLVRQIKPGEIDEIHAFDPRFDEMIAITGKDLVDGKQAYIDVINQCKEWR